MSRKKNTSKKRKTLKKHTIVKKSTFSNSHKLREKILKFFAKKEQKILKLMLKEIDDMFSNATFRRDYRESNPYNTMDEISKYSMLLMATNSRFGKLPIQLKYIRKFCIYAYEFAAPDVIKVNLAGLAFDIGQLYGMDLSIGPNRFQKAIEWFDRSMDCEERIMIPGKYPLTLHNKANILSPSSPVNKNNRAITVAYSFQ